METLVQELRGRRRPLAAPSFDGIGDVRRFLETFNQVAEANGWRDEERALQFKLTLRGTAADCIQGETFEEMCESLLSRLELSREEARRELRNLKLKTGQDVHLFADRVMKLVKIAEPELDEGQRDERATAELVDAIGDRLLTREFRIQGPINFADAIRRIQQYNSDMMVTRMRRMGLEEEESEIKELKERLKTVEDQVCQVSTKTAEAVEQMATMIKEIKTKLEEKDTTPSVPQRTWRPAPIYRGPHLHCYVCGTRGHMARNCFKRRFGPQANQSGNGQGRQ